MYRYIIGSLWDRSNRNGANANFEYLFEGRQKIDQLNNRAEGILKEAQQTNNMNKDVQSQVNKFISEFESTGETNFEVVRARADRETLNERLEFEESRIKEISGKTYHTTTRKERKPIVSIMFDDALRTDITVLKPIADEKGFPVSVAYITGDENGMAKSPMTYAEAKSLENSGWEILSHTASTSDLTAEGDRLEFQYKYAKAELLKHGFNAESMVYPVGLNDARVREMNRRYHRAGFGTNPGVNRVPLQTHNLYRVHIHDYDLETLKWRVDQIGNEGWLILYGHSATNQFTISEQNKLKDIVDYIKSKNIDLVTTHEALNMYENALEVANDGTGQSLSIGADGKIYSKDYSKLNHIYRPASEYVDGVLININNATSINDFEFKKVTTVPFTGGSNSGIPIGNGSGTLVTYRINDVDTLNYQVFYSESGIAMRKWMDTEWGGWEQFVKQGGDTPLTISREMNTYSATDPLNAYPPGFTISDVNSAGSTGFPATGGALKTYKSRQGSDWSYQEFKVIKSHVKYSRYPLTNSTWSEWVKSTP